MSTLFCKASVAKVCTHAALAEKGASPKYVQHRLGHKNVQVTMQIYQHLTEKMSQEGAQLLDTF